MNIEWVKVEPPKHFFNKVVVDIGDYIQGRVMEYHPTLGETDYEGHDCGVLVLWCFEREEEVVVPLDKINLKDQVRFARPREGMCLCVRYAEQVEKKGANSYKRYEVFIGHEQEQKQPEQKQEQEQPEEEATLTAQEKRRFLAFCGKQAERLGTKKFGEVLSHLGVVDPTGVVNRRLSAEVAEALKNTSKG